MSKDTDKLSDMHNQREKEIAALLAASPELDQLYAELGRELGASATGEDPGERGKSAYRRRLMDIRTAVCNNEQIRQYCSNPNYSDATTAASLVAGALVASQFSGLNVILVACISARLGLRTVCQAEWATSSKD